MDSEQRLIDCREFLKQEGNDALALAVEIIRFGYCHVGNAEYDKFLDYMMRWHKKKLKEREVNQRAV